MKQPKVSIGILKKDGIGCLTGNYILNEKFVEARRLSFLKGSRSIR